MRASRRAISALAVAGVAAGTVGVAAAPVDAVSMQRFGCVANAQPDGGPALVNGNVQGVGKGHCSPLPPWDVKFAEAWTFIEVQHTAGDPWIFGGGSVHDYAEQVWMTSAMRCLSGTYRYRVTTWTYGKDGHGGEVLQAWVSTPATQFSCK